MVENRLAEPMRDFAPAPNAGTVLKGSKPMIQLSRIVTSHRKKLIILHRRLGAVNDSNRTTCLCNLLNQAIIEVARFISDRQKTIYTLAAIGRNIYEIRLIAEYVILSDDNLKDWIGQRIADELQVLKSIKLLAAPPEDVAWIDERMDKLRQLGNDQGVTESNYKNPSTYADILGNTDEYTKYYRIFSKFTHPSSWVINDKKEAIESKKPNGSFYHVFLIKTDEFLRQLASITEDYVRSCEATREAQD